MSSSHWFYLLICLMVSAPNFSQADRWSRAGVPVNQRRSSNLIPDSAALTSLKTPVPTSTEASSFQDPPVVVTEALSDLVDTNEVTNEPELDVPILEECENDNIGYEIVTG